MHNWLTTKRFNVLLFVLFILSIFSALPILELRGEEPRRALIAIEMIFSGNYAVPTLNGECYYNNPPLFNWGLVILFKIFNSLDEWIVRLPSAYDEKIYFTGDLRKFTNSISIGNFELYKSNSEIVMPPYINYKIPYYITRNKKYIMRYHKKPQKRKFYIADYNYVKDKKHIKKIFMSNNNHLNNIAPDYALFKVE